LSFQSHGVVAGVWYTVAGGIQVAM